MNQSCQRFKSLFRELMSLNVCIRCCWAVWIQRRRELAGGYTPSSISAGERSRDTVVPVKNPWTVGRGLVHGEGPGTGRWHTSGRLMMSSKVGFLLNKADMITYQTWKLQWPSTPRAAAGLSLDRGGFGSWCKTSCPLFFAFFDATSTPWTGEPQDVNEKCVQACVCIGGGVNDGDRIGCWECFLRLHPLAPVHQN